MVGVALSEFEHHLVKRLVEEFVARTRPPEHLRGEVDLKYRISDQSVVIFLVRPAWRDRAAEIEERVAKATYVKRTGVWKVYWRGADLRWHGYTPKPVVDSFAEFLQLVDEDAWHCFWG